MSVDDLAACLDDSDVVVCDVRWYLTDPYRGRREYDDAHVPGAVFVDLHNDSPAASAVAVIRCPPRTSSLPT